MRTSTSRQLVERIRSADNAGPGASGDVGLELRPMIAIAAVFTLNRSAIKQCKSKSQTPNPRARRGFEYRAPGVLRRRTEVTVDCQTLQRVCSAFGASAASTQVMVSREYLDMSRWNQWCISYVRGIARSSLQEREAGVREHLV